MDRLVTCIPNFSEGRSQTTVRALIDAVASVSGILMLDHQMDPDHHRSVLTFAGEPDTVSEAAFRAIRIATDLIDIRQHEGVHPRVGATDVVPFVPVSGSTMQDCVALAKRLGQRVGQELGIPVFLYERAAPHPDHAPLESIRRGGLEGLAFRMASDPDWLPAFGPPRLHETAGAITIGARPPLIAFNVNLLSNDLGLARSIAKMIRQSNGGVPHLKAIGVELSSRSMVQVAMNLTDYEVTPIHTAFEAVREQASQCGVDIAGSEVIGLVPEAALIQTAAQALRLERFDLRQVLERKIEEALLSARALGSPDAPRPLTDLKQYSVSQLLDAVAAATPVPGGAAVSALVGALSASLGVMGARLSHQRSLETRLAEIIERLSELAQADGAAYQRFLHAARLPKSAPNRLNMQSSALHVATEIPLEIAERAMAAGTLIKACSQHVKPRAQSDLVVGFLLAIAAGEASLHTVQENIKVQSNQKLKDAVRTRIEAAAVRLEELKELCYTPPPNRWAAKGNFTQASPGKAQKRNGWKSESSTITLKKRSKSPRKNSRGKGFSGS